MNENKNAKLFIIINQEGPEVIRNKLLSRLISSHKVDVNAKDENTGETLLHIAIRKGLKHLIRFFEALEVKVDIPDNTGISVRNLLDLQEYSHLKRICRNLLLSEEERIAQEKSFLEDELPNNAGINRDQLITEGKEDDSNPVQPKKKHKTDEDPQQEYSCAKNGAHRTKYLKQLLVLLACRASLRRYNFRLEVYADKFERIFDLGFQYFRDDGKKIGRLLRSIHIKNKWNLITYSDLCSEYSWIKIVKMFKYYKNIKMTADFTDSDIDRIIFSTNVDLGPKIKSVLSAKLFNDLNDIFNLESDTKYYKLNVPEGHKLYDILRESTDACALAKMLLYYITKQDTLHLLPPIFQKYHTALAKSIISETRDSFSMDFLENVQLDPEVKKFRNCMIDEFWRMSTNKCELKVQDPERYFIESMKNIKLKLTPGFGVFYELPNVHPLNANELAKALVDAILAESSTTLTLDRAQNPIIMNNIDLLAGYVIERLGSKLVITSWFLHKEEELPPKLQELRKEIVERLKSTIMTIHDLADYDLMIEEYKTCEKGQQFAEINGKLPSDGVNDKDIKDFFERLTLAVNQPELDVLKYITEMEIKAGISEIVRSDLLMEFYEDEILNCIKSKDGSKFLTSEDMKAITELVATKINNTIVISLANYYCDILDELDVTYKPLDCEFRELIQQERTSQKFSEKQNLTRSLLILQALDELRNGSLSNVTFLPVNKVLMDGSKEVIIKVFRFEDQCKRLLLEMTGIKEENYKQIRKLCDDILDSIGRDDEDRLITFNDLSRNCKEFVLLRNVTFQGQIVKLKAILLTPESEKRLNLGSFVSNKEMIIGRPIDNLNRFYFPRLFSRSVALKKEVLDKDGDVFALTCDHQETLRMHFKDVILFGELEGKPFSNKVVLNLENAENQFEAMLQFPSYNENDIHWLHYDTKWELFYLMNSKEANSKPLGLYSATAQKSVWTAIKAEEELLELQENLIILCGDLCSGKTYILQKMSLIIKEKDPLNWAFHINLSRCKEIFNNKEIKPHWAKSFMYSRELDEVSSFFVKLINLHGNIIGKSEEGILNEFIEEHKISFLFDGFGDLNEDHRKLAVCMLQGLKHLKPKYFLITTTPSVRWELEKAFNVAVYNIQPIAPHRHVEFLSEYLKYNTKIELDYIKEATKLITFVKNKCDVARFLNVPRFLDMLGEYFINDIKGLTSTEIESLEVNIDVEHIKKRFLKICKPQT